MPITKAELLDPKFYIERFLHIKTKSGDIIPFRFNAAQQQLYDIVKTQKEKRLPIRIIILKARQLGFSTLTEALLYHSSATKPGVNSLIVAHTEEATVNLFSMSRLFHEKMPDGYRVMKKASNAQELLFENPTRDPMLK